MSPRMQAKCNAVVPDVLSVLEMFGQSSCCRQRMSVARDVGLKVELSLIVRSIPGRSKMNFTRERSPDRMTVCRGAQPRGWRVLMRVGKIARSLHITSGFKYSMFNASHCGRYKSDIQLKSQFIKVLHKLRAPGTTQGACMIDGVR